MKRIVKIGGSCCAVLIMLAVALGFLTDLTERKASYFKYEPFFSQEEDFDVLFMGTSHLINAVFPMELWKDYGIVSYNFGGHGNQLATTYWVMENALNYTTPKLMVIDCYYLEYETKTSVNFAQVHLSFDAFPNNQTKRQAVLDLLDDPALQAVWTTDAKQRTKLNLLWDYAVYHDRWNELGSDDFEPASTVEKGAESRIAISAPYPSAEVPEDSILEGETTGVVYLRKMIEDCQKRGIDVLLTYLPFPAEEVDWKNTHRVSEIAKEYGVQYLDFLDMGLENRATDYYDPVAHLNPSGARKITEYLGQYIKDHYKIPDQRENERYQSWHEDYQAYIDYKLANLREQASLDLYLMLLKDKNYHTLIEINGPEIQKDEYYAAVLENLGVEVKQITDQTDFLVIREGGKGVDYLKGFHESGSQNRSAIGEFQMWKDETGENSGGAAGTQVVFLDGKELYRVGPEEAEAENVRVAVVDKETKEVVEMAGFSFAAGGWLKVVEP